MNTSLTINQARRQANCFTKAQGMLKEGYRAQQYGKTVGWAVFKPENKETANARANYFVDMTPGAKKCECPDFEKHGDYCKHTLFVEMECEHKRQQEEMMEAICAEYEMRAAYEW